MEKEAETVRQKPVTEKQEKSRTETKKKLSFKEKQEFEALEKEIPLLEQEKSELETSMSSGSLSNEELIAGEERIAHLMEEIDEKTMRWLELSELA